MSREIKFRAWDKMTGLMIEWYDHYTESNEIFIPMQFVGKKDINSKKIFESDLIKVGKLKDLHEVVYDEEYALFRMKKINSETGLGFGQCQYRIEIVGNIYENPELLNQQ